MEIRILALLIWVGVSSSSLGVVEAQRSLNALPQNSAQLGPAKTSSSSKDAGVLPPEDPSRHAKIMKQINKVNDDGSYTFGYEADDGSFRVETRTKDGVVKGKYGYLDATGQLKVMEYTAGEKVAGAEEPEEEDEESAVPQGPTQGGPQIRRSGVANAPIPNFRPLPLAPAGPARVSRPLPPPSPQLPASTVALGRSVNSDQTIAAQTPTQTSVQQQQQQQRERQPQAERGREEEADEDDQPEDEDEGGNRDVNNGQYFRAISSPQSGGGGGRPGGPGQDEGPRYVPTHPGPSQHFSGFPSQFAPQPTQSSQRPGGLPQGFSTLGQQGPQGQGQYPQGLGPITAYPGGQFDDDERSGNSLGLGGPGGQPQFGGPGSSPQYGGLGGRPAPPNVNVQFRGSPQPQQPSSPYGGRPTQNPLLLQSPYSQEGGLFGGPQQGPQGGRGFPLSLGRPQQPQEQQEERGQFGRGLSSQPGQVEDQQERQPYSPNPELDGYSEDADEDGFVDRAPQSGGEGLKGQSQEKQGVSVQPGRGSPNNPYTPTVLGPQGVLQGGRVQAQQPLPQVPQQPTGLGGQGGQGQAPFFVGGGSNTPTLTQEQFQQFLQQQNEQFNGSPQQGLAPQAFQQQGQVPGRSFGGGVSNIGQGQNGLFSQFGQQGQPQFLGGGGGPGERQQPGQLGLGGGQFQGQQNSLLQGGQGQQPFAGFSQLPQQQQQQFGGQGLQGGILRPGGQGQFLGGQPGGQQFLGGQDGQGPQQGQFLGQPGQGGQFLGQDEQSQFLGQQPGGQGQQQFLGGGQGGGGLPQGFQSGGGQNGGGLQSSSFPFDFNPFGGLPGQLQGASPGQSQFGQSQGGGLSPSQLQALQGQGLSAGGGQFQPQGFPQQQGGFPPGALQGGFLQGGGPQGQQQQLGGGLFSPSQQGGQFGGQSPSSLAGYVPGRFPGGPLQQQQIPQLSLGGGSPSAQGQQRSLGQSIQLGGGPRPVQAGSSGSSSTVYGSDARKQLSSKGGSSPSSSAASKPSN